jgi:hypothetical protein
MPRASKRDAVRASASNAERPTGAGKRSTQPHPRYEPPRWPIHPAKVTIPATAPAGPDELPHTQGRVHEARQPFTDKGTLVVVVSVAASPVECVPRSKLAGQCVAQVGRDDRGGRLPRDEVEPVLAGARRQRRRRFHTYCQQGRRCRSARVPSAWPFRRRPLRGGRACGPSFDRTPNREAPPLRSCLMLKSTSGDHTTDRANCNKHRVVIDARRGSHPSGLGMRTIAGRARRGTRGRQPWTERPELATVLAWRSMLRVFPLRPRSLVS